MGLRGSLREGVGVDFFFFFFTEIACKNRGTLPLCGSRRALNVDAIRASRRPATDCRLYVDETSTRYPKTSEDDRRSASDVSAYMRHCWKFTCNFSCRISIDELHALSCNFAAVNPHLVTLTRKCFWKDQKSQVIFDCRYLNI